MTGTYSRLLLLLLTSVSLYTCNVRGQEYNEQLNLQPLPPRQLLASFQFSGSSPAQAFEQQHFQVFPRSLGQVLQHAHTRELHLRFSTGRWDSDAWGERPWHGTKEGGTGVELWAWVEGDPDEQVYARWITLNNALSGLFCASMNFIDATRTSQPVMTFEPEGDHIGNSTLHLLHGTLPHEVVCTENLTPFIKMLPCKGKAGIASLLDGHRVFDSTWQSMAIDVVPKCNTDGECAVKIDQTIDMVLDLERSLRLRYDSIPRPVPRDKLPCAAGRNYTKESACFPMDLITEEDFTLSNVFAKKVNGLCHLRRGGDNDIAKPSICINTPHERQIFASDGVQEHKSDAGDRRCLLLPEDTLADLYFLRSIPSFHNPIVHPRLHVERSISGYGQQRGGLSTIFTNPSDQESIEFTVFETLPWYMKPFLHTLRARLNGKPTRTSDLIRESYFRPNQDRKRGTQLEMRIVVPPASSLTLTYDFEKAILRYTEYPPDANRGFDIASAVVRLQDVQGPGQSAYLRTTNLLLPLPTPDFSMPYNVIILTSTVIALAFGSIFTILTRRFVAADEVPPNERLERLKGHITRLREQVLVRFSVPRSQKKKQ